MSRSARVFSALLLTLAASLGSAHVALSQGPAAAPAAPVPERSPEEIARRKQIVAKADGGEVTVGEVEDFLNAQPPMMRERYRTPEERKKLVDNMLRVELLSAEAIRKGYDKNPAVVRTVKDSSVQALLRSEIDAKYSPQTVSADEVKKYYEVNSAEFHRPAMRRASVIVVATEADAKKLLPEAQKADVRKFADLAKQHSIDPESKMRSGDIGYFGKEPAAASPNENVQPSVRAAAFALKNSGDTAAKPVAVETGFAIVRLTGERPERNTELAEAELTIRTKLWREQRQKALAALVDGLRSKEKPQVFGDRAEWIKFDDMDRRPPGFAPDRAGPAGGRPAKAPEEKGAAPGANP
jgi:peptidyl-prolyl cis-trans isomerase C